MRQVFRLMAMPDKVIAFDELPARLLEGFEMVRADGFPRYWKDYLGKTKKITKIPPERDLITGQVRRFDPIVEEDAFFYMVDWNVNPVVEKWNEVCDYVRSHVDKEFRLKEKFEDMALPLAANKTDGVTLEPEDVLVIPLPKESEQLIVPSSSSLSVNSMPMTKCSEPGCEKSFDDKRAMRMHIMKKHSKEPAAI